MTQQKSERSIVPKGGRKAAPTCKAQPCGGGKGFPVNKEVQQLELPLATAENPTGAAKAATRDRSPVAALVVPKASVHAKQAVPATMEEVTKRLTLALRRVAKNRGAPGPDGERIGQVQARWSTLEPELTAALLRGSYRPDRIRRVHIPKAGGGQRGLGIPNVVDRVVQEAIRQVLEPLYEPTFHASNHGFRRGRSCHTAIAEAKKHLASGKGWVVDLDLEKFFDKVHHQRLMSRLSEQVTDRRILDLVWYMLKAGVVMPDGVGIARSDKGVPQGGPLSPLLSNIVLTELDNELGRRGHAFVRYADDVTIFVQSERAGHRVMASIRRFISSRLRLVVNPTKSAVSRPKDRHMLGFSLWRNPEDGTLEVRLSERTKRRIYQRIRELTPRNWGGTLKRCIDRVNVYLRGWYGYFGHCSAQEEYWLQRYDAHVRRRLRAIQLKHWKRRRTIARKLIALGVRWKTAWRRVYEGRKSLWALSIDWVANNGLRNVYFAERGLFSLVDCHRQTIKARVASTAQQGLWG